MKNNARFISVGIFLSAFIMVILFGGQKADWKGKIEIEDGVKVIKNPGEPLHGEITLELEEDLSIGNEDDENYMFYSLIRIAVDSEENIFVLDGGNCRIQKFDKNGSYLQTIGRRGQGPGEFENPWSIHIDLKDRIYVSDPRGRNLHVFEKEGKFIEARRLAHALYYEFSVADNGNILIQIWISTPEFKRKKVVAVSGRKRDLVLMDSKGKVIKRIVSHPYAEQRFVRNVTPGNHYSHRQCFYPALNGSGIYSHSSEYKLHVLGTSGETKFRIEKDEKPEPITQKDIREYMDRYLERQEKSNREIKLTRNELKKALVFPKIKPFMTEILLDNEGRIYVKRFKLTNPKDRSEVYDFFSEEGYYIYRVKMPLSPTIIRNGCIYRIERDQDTGYTKVKRYRIKNWDQIKKFNGPNGRQIP